MRAEAECGVRRFVAAVARLNARNHPRAGDGLRSDDLAVVGDADVAGSAGLARAGSRGEDDQVSGMQFGIFTVGDVTPDPATGRMPTEGERIRTTVAIARKAEEVGLDVFATGEHHNPPFVPSSPTTLLGLIAGQTERIILSTSTTLITTNDPVKIAEDFSVLQHLSGGRVDVMLGRGNTGPVYPWFGQDGHPPGDAAHGRALRTAAPAVAGGGGGLGGTVPLTAAGLHAHATSARRRSPVRVARLHPDPRGVGVGGLPRRRFLRQPHLLAAVAHAADGTTQEGSP
jgi:hypothetical protein